MAETMEPRFDTAPPLPSSPRYAIAISPKKVSLASDTGGGLPWADASVVMAPPDSSGIVDEGVVGSDKGAPGENSPAIKAGLVTAKSIIGGYHRALAKEGATVAETGFVICKCVAGNRDVRRAVPLDGPAINPFISAEGIVCEDYIGPRGGRGPYGQQWRFGGTH